MRSAFVLLLAISIIVVGATMGMTQESPNVEGTLTGVLKVGAIELTVILHIKKQDDKFVGTLDSPDQGAKGIPISQITLEGRKLFVEVKAVGGVYEGTVSEDGSEIVGEWRQSGLTLPLTFKVGGQAPERRRPQEPKPPFPYRVKEVTFVNKKAGITLAGTLTIPKDKGPFPAVVLITGSGCQNRDEEVAGHKPFLVLADYLTRKGIAVMRYDDRGVGKSEGDFVSATTFDFADDALAAVAYLKTRKEINPKQIGLIGHSEGGLVASIVAAQSQDIAFIVMMAGTGVNGEQVIYRQSELIAKAHGASDEAIAKNRAVQERIFAIVKSEQDNEAARQKIQEAMKELVATLTEEERKALIETGIFEAQTKLILTPWFRIFLTLEPTEYLRKVKCPVLAMTGEKDLQVDPKQNLPAIKKALLEGSNRKFLIRELAGLNHLFQYCKTGSPLEYAKIEETMALEALQLIAEWILARTK